jgi:hypothetical protein
MLIQHLLYKKLKGKMDRSKGIILIFAQDNVSESMVSLGYQSSLPVVS